MIKMLQYENADYFHGNDCEIYLYFFSFFFIRILQKFRIFFLPSKFDTEYRMFYAYFQNHVGM